MAIGILAYGSLVDDPGDELASHIVDRIQGVQTPFRVEFARSSHSRDRAPTLVPVRDGGTQVKAVLPVLDADVSPEMGKDMLYRREISAAGDLGHRYDPTASGPNAVHIGELRQEDAFGLDVVLYSVIGENISPLIAEHLAELAIRSARCQAGRERRDGISYLQNALANGIRTPLSGAYRHQILLKTGTASLTEAWAACRSE